MKTITLPILVLALLLLLVALTIHFIVGRRCKALRDCLLENCKVLFNSYEEVRGIAARLKGLDNPKLTAISDDLLDRAEKERKITASMKNTIQDAL